MTTASGSTPVPPPAEPTTPVEVREFADGQTDVVQADRLLMSRSAAREVSAREARLESSAVVVVEATDATVNNSACLQVLGEEITVNNTPSLMLAAERATLHNSPVFLFLGRAEGEDLRPLLDWRAAVGLGAAFGAALAVVGAFLRGRSR